MLFVCFLNNLHNFWKGPMHHKPTLHQTTSNQWANIYSSLINARSRGQRSSKKSVPASLKLMVWRKLQERKAADMEVGMGQTTNWSKTALWWGWKIKEKIHSWEFLALNCVKKMPYTPDAYLNQLKYYSFKEYLISHPSQAAWPQMHRRATQWTLAKWIAFLSLSLRSSFV